LVGEPCRFFVKARARPNAARLTGDAEQLRSRSSREKRRTIGQLIDLEITIRPASPSRAERGCRPPSLRAHTKASSGRSRPIVMINHFSLHTWV
jgi:hypothetical protein